ncbi:P-loop containing nucleoside triphosphate hydrolase protein [Aureobasidium pullulans EXF-150]|uniref:p-loop containing nucleoside triphosphate hydrolase protein n=1 Tax=Aureobasidium pullulans EXF-150 TaxID=1043002 RepID=A0A074XVP1_AURPU|nr:P-loop containing nucleoside triphosphate hydrolase protein [Aureobasidium pullulans EXF-150]KEQ78736.1 P-loop containing nucleoside triphosphate hydrolase protein [Aureobasidium pullulans EXF-150]
MLPQSSRSPGQGSEDFDPLLELALPQTPTDDYIEVLDDISDDESDDDQDVKDARAKRLSETNGWLGYLRDFTIFIPFVVPRKDFKIQLCLLLCIITFTLERVIQAAIPYTLGLIADKITSGVMPIRELLIFLALDVANCESGLLLVQELSKIPIKQFSYRGLTNAAFNHVMAQSIDFHSTQDSAEVMKAVEQGESLGMVLQTVVFDIAPPLVDVIVACAIFYRKFNPAVALILLGSCIIYLIAQGFSTKLTAANRRDTARAERFQIRKIHQAIQGWQTVAYFNQFKREAKTLSDAVFTHSATRAKFERKQALIQAVVELSIPATWFALAYMILQRIAAGKTPPGDFVFFLTYWDAIIYPLQYLINHIRWLAGDFVDAERLLLLLKTKPSVVDAPEAHPLAVRDGGVRFEDVSFMYDEGRYALRNISFTASPGQTIAFVGQTGAGKSSILKLLLRLHDITSGSITISDQQIQNVTLSSLRDAISVVPQTPMFFNASIIENVRYARSSATDEEVFEACRAAAIHDTIMRHSDGYNTQVGERGVKLSGGEAQRLAIARALLRNTPIVLLDEATSAIDTVTEGKVKGALERLKQGRTVLVVAHRLSTIADADQILVLHEGEIVERGRHQELCEVKGNYWALWVQS